MIIAQSNFKELYHCSLVYHQKTPCVVKRATQKRQSYNIRHIWVVKLWVNKTFLLPSAHCLKTFQTSSIFWTRLTKILELLAWFSNGVSTIHSLKVSLWFECSILIEDEDAPILDPNLIGVPAFSGRVPRRCQFPCKRKKKNWWKINARLKHERRKQTGLKHLSKGVKFNFKCFLFHQAM